MEAKKRRGLYIPHDIREEILVKVPVRSLVRFKAVSKEWRGSIESKRFVEKHTNHQKREARIVSVVSCSGRRIGKSLSLENLLFMSTNGIVRSCPYRRIRPLRLPRHQGFKISEPCDGLFCIYTKDRELSLVNPATNSRRTLPDPSTDVVSEEDGWIKSYYLLGMGRENGVSPPRYKLVWFYKNKEGLKMLCTTRCKVFALDSNTWNQVLDRPNCRVYYDEPIVHLDGVLYCLGFNMEEKHIINKLVLAFDLHTETFQRYSVPPEIGSTYKWKLSMCVLNHRLCMFSNCTPDINERFFKIWGLDINKRSWEIMYSLEFSCFPQLAHRIIIPVATLDDYLILRDYRRTLWVLYGSKTRTLCSSSYFASNYFMSFFETLVSVQ